MGELLALEGVSAGYGEALVLSDVTLSVEEGQALALLGRNGMGKTSVIATIMGTTNLRAGRIRFGGADIGRVASHRRALAGLGWVPQEREIFPSLTVEENLTAVARPGPWTISRIYELFPRLKERRANLGSQLSGGEQQMLAIGRALMARPKLILMDEPSMGLSPLLVKEVFGIIRQINRDLGVTILLVEQNARMALGVAGYGYIMESGKVVLDGTAQELSENEDVKEFYLGGAGDQRKSFKNLKSYKRRKRWL